MPGDTLHRRAAPRRRHRADHLRGPLAGRRPVRGGRARPGSAWCVNINGSPYERNKDDVRLPLVARRAREAGAAGRLRQHGRRPGRAGLRRRLDGRRRPTATCSPGPPQFAEELLVHRPRAAGRVDDRCRPTGHDDEVDIDPHVDAMRGTGVDRDAATRAVGPRPTLVADRLDRRGRGVAGARPRAARLRAQERLPLGRPRRCPAASTRRSSRPSPPTRSAPRKVYGVSMPSGYSSEHSRSRRRRPGQAHRPATTATVADPADGRRVPVQRCR